MGKIFVKGPTESPDDLLAKQTMAQRFKDFATTRNIRGAGRELGTSAGRFANNEIQNFGQFASALANPLIALLGRKPMTPEEEAYARILAREKATQQRQAELAPQREAELLSRFRNLTQRSPALVEAAQLSGESPQSTLADFQQYVDNVYPGMSMNEVADMLGRQFSNVEALNVRRRATGKEGVEGLGSANQTANELVTASNAAEQVNVGGDGLAPMPARLRNQIDTEDMATMGGKVPLQTQTQISPADNAASVAASGGVNSSQASAFKEIDRDEEMINDSANIDNKNTPGAGVEPPKQEDNAGEVPNFGAAPPLPTDVSNQANISNNFGLNPNELGDMLDEQQRQREGEQ